jgi:predicted nucleic acid-binding protein
VRKLAQRVVLDASAVVETLGEFAFPGAARAILEAVAFDPDGELWAPDIVYAESASALRKLVVRGLLDAKAGARGIANLLALPLNVSGTAPLVADAWSMRDAITIYDGCYVALARHLEATFVTGDGALARALGSLNVNVLHLGDLS